MLHNSEASNYKIILKRHTKSKNISKQYTSNKEEIRSTVKVLQRNMILTKIIPFMV